MTKPIKLKLIVEQAKEKEGNKIVPSFERIKKRDE